LYIIFALWALVGEAWTDQPPLTVDAYWRRVEDTRALLASMQEADHGQLQAVANEWDSITHVILADGTQVPVDHSYLVSLLRAEEPDLALLDHLLGALLEARDAWPRWAEHSYDPDVLQRILSRREFQWELEWELESPSWLQDLFSRLLEWLFRVQTAIADVVGRPISRFVLTVLGALILALVLSYALRGLMADLALDAELEEVQEGDVPLTAASALKRAQLLSEGKDYRSAVRYLYLSAILVLEERGLLRYDRSQTNREYLRSVSHLPRLVGVLRSVVDVFERVWYGYRPIDRDMYEQYEAQVRELERQK
jgi:hypothetical protein